MKTLAGGVGVATAATIPATGINVSSDEDMVFKNSTTGETKLSVGSNGLENIHSIGSGSTPVKQANVEKLIAKEVYDNTRVPDVTIKNDSGRYRAIGRQGLIQEGSNAAAVIQAASDYVGVGGTIQIKSGIYHCSSVITLHESQWLLGAGMYQTTLKATSELGGHLLQSQNDNGENKDERIRVSQMTIDIDDQGHSAIFFFISQECIIDHVNAINAGARDYNSSGGILLRNAFGIDGKDQWLINNRAENCSNHRQ